MAIEDTTNEYKTLIDDLGYGSSTPNTGLIRGDELRQKHSAGDGLDDRRFRYASILDPRKLGVTDVFEINGAPCIYLKSLSAEPSAEQIHNWHRTAWNHGLGRMLWIVTPTQIRVLNSFQPPPKSEEQTKHPAEILRCATNNLEQLRRYELDRISLESGQFWATKAGKRISKDTRIDAALAKDLHDAADILTERGCKTLQAHRLMLRTLFTAYLEARGVLSSDLFEGLIGKNFGDVLSRVGETRTFFERMRETFNGDLFPPPPTVGEEDETYSFSREQLSVARAIVTRQDLRSGQKTFDFWRYDFEVIPIELISSIYERFIYADDQKTAKARGTHYTPVNLVDLVFSQVFDDHLFSKELPCDAKVLDLACGSGVFLVDAFRRLVARRIAAGEKLTRTLVRDVLANQIFGVDINETAIEIAAFSLCLTAFELDPSPSSAQHLKFRHSLKGRNLFVDDAFSSKGFANCEPFKSKQFSVVVGNPPWNKPKGERSASELSSRSHIEYCERQNPPVELPFRSPIDQAVIWRSRDFLQAAGRIGLILDAKNFFSQEEQSLRSKRQLFTRIRPRVMLNLSVLHNKKLFPSAEQPAMIYIAENNEPRNDDTLVFASAERTETFRKHGIVELFLDRLNHLPVSRIPDEPHLFKIASYGTARDRAINRSLVVNTQTFESVLSKWRTGLHQGFIKGDCSRLVPVDFPPIKLEDSLLDRFELATTTLPPFSYLQLQWPRHRDIYNAPLFLAQRSLQDDRLVGAKSDNDVVYSRTFFGIPLPQSEAWRLDLVNAFINSSLATYCFFMTSTCFGIDKQIAEQNDFDRLPFRTVTSESEIKALTDAMRSVRYADISNLALLDEAIFEFYNLPKWQREYITDTIHYDLNFMRHGSDGVAAESVDDDQLLAYADTIVKFIRSNIEGGELFVNADVAVNQGDVCCVVIRFDESRNRGVRLTSESGNNTNARLAELLHAPLTSNIQLRRSLIHFDDDRCMIVKLNQRRFWSRARAYDDADVIFDELCRGGD